MHSSPGIVSRFALKTRCLLARVPLGGGRQCCLCGSHVGWFLPYRRGWNGAPPLMRALGVVGSAATVGALTLVIAFVALLMLHETYGKDLNYLET